MDGVCCGVGKKEDRIPGELGRRLGPCCSLTVEGLEERPGLYKGRMSTTLTFCKTCFNNPFESSQKSREQVGGQRVGHKCLH